MEGDDDVDNSENTYLELISSLKSNKQILRKILHKDEVVPAKKSKINNGDDDSDNLGNVTKRGSNDVNGGAEEEEESEEDGEEEDDEDEEDSDEDEDSENDEIDEANNANKQSLDPFKIHFEKLIEETTADEIGKCKFQKSEKKNLNNNVIMERHILPASVASQLDGFLVDLKDENEDENELLRSAAIKDNLILSWKLLEKSKKVWTNKTHNSLFRMITSYKDVFHFDSAYEYWDKVRHLYVLHIVNHVLKSRSRILKNNAKISQSQKENKDIEDCRDQGLTRPKVLILVPYKNFCLDIVNDIIKLLFAGASKAQIMQKKRFMEEFSPDPNEKESKLERPDDYKATFKGNIDDCFRIGLSISKNTLKLYSEFYSADVIIASPLGLRTIIGGEGEKQDYDFLSSIEILIMDQADVFLMQNWEHLVHIFDYLNLIPKQSHGNDYSRARMFTVNGWAKYYRQTMLFSSTQSPELNGIFNKYCWNYNGKVKYISTNTNGTISQIASQISQVYHRVNCNAFTDLPDARFDYFVKKVLPDFKSNLFSGTAVFVPSYFDFVRMRNYFKKENLSFVQISEYAKRSNITKSRSTFLAKTKHFLLFTERFHFFYRYRLRGIRHIIFYELPQYPNFYSEIINFMTSNDAASSVSCTVLYSRFGGFKLEAVVGSSRCKQLITSAKDTHMLVTG